PYSDFTNSPTLLFVRRRAAARLRDVLLFDLVDVELLRARDDPVERFVEIERRRFRKPRVVHARDDERFEVRTGQALRLQLLHGSAHGIVELENQRAAALALFQRLVDPLVEEHVDAPEDGLVRPAAQTGAP